MSNQFTHKNTPNLNAPSCIVQPPLNSSNDPKHSDDLDLRTVLGIQGEQLALTYLEEQGYLLEAKNWRGRRGELDLVMRHETTLVIIEVRTTSTQWLERPSEATPISKQRQVARCADEYLQQRHPQAVPIFDIRFDVIGIRMNQDHLDRETPHQIDHVEDAYYSPFAY